MNSPNLTPLSAQEALDRYFLEARSKLLDLAAILDRIGRGKGGATVADARLKRVQAALEILHDGKDAKAERIQQLFSLEYDPNWERPTPR